MTKPSGQVRSAIVVRGPNKLMYGLGSKLKGHFGPGSVVVQGLNRGECRVVVKSADPVAVKTHLLDMGLSIR